MVGASGRDVGRQERELPVPLRCSWWKRKTRGFTAVTFRGHPVLVLPLRDGPEPGSGSGGQEVKVRPQGAQISGEGAIARPWVDGEFEATSRPERRGLWGCRQVQLQRVEGPPTSESEDWCHLGNLRVLYAMPWKTHRGFTLGSAPACMATGQARPLSACAARQQKHGVRDSPPFGTVPEFTGGHRRKFPGHGRCSVNHRNNDHNDNRYYYQLVFLENHVASNGCSIQYSSALRSL